MSKLKAKIVHDVKVEIFYPSPDRVNCIDHPDSPLLKRLAPKRPKQQPPPKPKQDDNKDE